MRVNEIIEKIVNYIEEHLCEEINMAYLSKLVGVNEFIMNQLFSYTCNISISGYIRNRRLSKAAYDLMGGSNVLEVALKYGYENATSFARAFEKFHGIKPSKVKKLDSDLKNYPVIHLNIEDNNLPLSYKIVDGDDMVLYGKCVRSDEKHINKDAPEFWSYMNKKYHNKYGNIDYGAVVTTSVDQGLENYEYWILYDQEITEFEKFVVPKSKYLVFRIDNVEAEDIQNMCSEVFNNFLPSTNYTFKLVPELEHYHDDVVDYYVPIL